VQQTTQWSKEKVQKYKQRSTKHAHKTKDRVTRTPIKPEKGQTMIYKTIQRRTDNNNGQKKKGKK
jgi:hypothetical protein